MKLQWIDFTPLPPQAGKEIQPGVAGALAGVHGDYMMVAGGANFEKGMPWEGGPKVLHDAIFLLRSGERVWRQISDRLPHPMGYAACVSLPQGVLAAGGDVDQGQIDQVALFAFADGKIHRTLLPSLPRPLSAAGATVVAHRVYLAGGMDGNGAVDAFYCLDMNHLAARWEVLPPLPQPLSHVVVAGQSDGEEICIYVLGGRFRNGDLSTFSSAVWKYKPSRRQWQQEGPIMNEGSAFALSAGTGIAVRDRYILLIGGDPGDLFNKTEQFNNAIEKAASDAERRQLVQQKTQHLTSHPGFSRQVLCYDTVTKTWQNPGETPAASQVTTQIFYWGDTIVIPSGEVRPGTRTPRVVGIRVEE